MVTKSGLCFRIRASQVPFFAPKKRTFEYCSRASFGQFLKIAYFRLIFGKKKWMEMSALKGGGRRLMVNAILNFYLF